MYVRSYAERGDGGGCRDGGGDRGGEGGGKVKSGAESGAEVTSTHRGGLGQGKAKHRGGWAQVRWCRLTP